MPGPSGTKSTQQRSVRMVWLHIRRLRGVCEGTLGPSAPRRLTSRPPRLRLEAASLCEIRGKVVCPALRGQSPRLLQSRVGTADAGPAPRSMNFHTFPQPHLPVGTPAARGDTPARRCTRRPFFALCCLHGGSWTSGTRSSGLASTSGRQPLAAADGSVSIGPRHNTGQRCVRSNE